jgi:hypothetical protein
MFVHRFFYYIIYIYKLYNVGSSKYECNPKRFMER